MASRVSLVRLRVWASTLRELLVVRAQCAPSMACALACCGARLSACLHVTHAHQHSRLCSGLVHPHFIVPRSLLRTPSALCVTADAANGGNLFAVVRRSGRPGLPTAAAAFLFQQLVAAAQFAQRHSVWLHALPPSEVLVNWTLARVPILRVNIIDFNETPRCAPATPGKLQVRPRIHMHAARRPRRAELVGGHACMCRSSSSP